MLVVVAVLLAARGGGAWYSAKCVDTKGPELTIDDTTADVPGQYRVQYCAEPCRSPQQLYQWVLMMKTLTYTEDLCTYEHLQQKHSGKSHSESVEDISSTVVNGSCPYICISKVMDLLYESCYRIENKFICKENGNTRYKKQSTEYSYVKNGLDRSIIDKVSSTVECTDWDTFERCEWFEGQIPFADYEISIWNASNPDEGYYVNENCTRVGGAGAGGRISCKLYLSPGNWTIQMRHVAPWTRGHSDLVHHRYNFTKSAIRTPHRALPPAAMVSAGVVWGSAGGAALALVLLAGLVVHHSRRKAKLRLKIIREWLNRQTEEGKGAEGVDGSGGAGGGGGSVLLLYARDCPPAMRVAEALRDALAARLGDKGKVLDLYDPTLVSVAGPASATFVRECMLARGVRVLLLQTPALAALHAVRLHTNSGGDTPTLESPLLPRAVMYRQPKFGDELLRYALQLLAETAHAQPAPQYKKYFLATISNVPVEIFPGITPYSRFELPCDAPALLAALAPPAAPATPAAPPALSAAAADLVQYLLDKPDYFHEYFQMVAA